MRLWFVWMGVPCAGACWQRSGNTTWSTARLSGRHPFWYSGWPGYPPPPPMPMVLNVSPNFSIGRGEGPGEVMIVGCEWGTTGPPSNPLGGGTWSQTPPPRGTQKNLSGTPTREDNLWCTIFQFFLLKHLLIPQKSISGASHQKAFCAGRLQPPPSPLT